MDNPEDLRVASTIEEVRAEISRQYRFSPFVRSAFEFAKHQQWSDENMYAYLAYHLLKANGELTALVLDQYQSQASVRFIQHGQMEE